LEHLRHAEVSAFLFEQKRVLARDGTIRIVVPDLEQVCRNYLEFLDQLVSGHQAPEFKYDYTLLELFDQVARDAPGGEMLRLWSSGTIADPDFVKSRSGDAIEDLTSAVARDSSVKPRVRRSPTKRATRKIFATWKLVRIRTAEVITSALLGTHGAKALRVGLFRSSGEVHRAMYDRYSLKRLLHLHGFHDVRTVSAKESRIPGFDLYCLDVAKGLTRKPDSIFVEATRGD